MSKRILTVGEAVNGATSNVTWDEVTEEIPTLGDFEHIFINLQTLSMGNLARLATINFSHKMVEALNAHTRIYCLTSPNIHAGGKSNYSIFPFKISAVSEKGEAFKDKPADGYFRKVKSWNFYLTYQGQAPWRFESVLETRHNHDVSLSVHISGYTAYGFVYFFPPQNLPNGESSFKNLFTYILSDDSTDSKLPDYIDKFLVTGEKELTNQIDTDKKSLETISERVNGNLDKLKEIKLKKGILAFKGKPLESAVKKVCMDLGIPISGVEIYEEDGILELDGNSIPVEIKGHSKGMSLNDVRQIIQRGQKAKTKPEVTIQGILIGNPYSESNLQNRGKDFEDNVTKAAESFNVCLLSTRVLFEYWKDFLKYGKSLLPDKILNTIGVLQFEPYQP